jgi:hypothetical protein
MAIIRMVPPASGLYNTITIDTRVYSSSPGNSTGVQDFDASVLAANGWTFAPTPPTNALVRNIPNGVFAGLDSEFQFSVGALPGTAQFVSRLGGGSSILAHAIIKHAADLNTNSVYVAPWGNDSNAGTCAAPYLTWAQAVRTSTASFVNLMGFTYRNPLPPDDYRNTDAPGGALKIVRGLGAPQVLGTTGTDLTQAAWSGASGTYSTVVNAYPGKVLYYGGGNITPLAFYASSASLTGNIWGWAYVPGTATLYVRLGGGNVSLVANLLRAVYNSTTPATPGAPRMLVYGNTSNVKLAMENVHFDGVYPYVLGNSPAAVPELYLLNVECTDAVNSYGIQVDSGLLYIQNATIRRGAEDGINYKNASSPTSPVSGFECNVISEFAGDIDTNSQSTITYNQNGSSNDTTNGSPVVRLNGVYRWSLGPTLPDSCSWNLGVTAGPSAVPFDQSAGVIGADFLAQTSGSNVWCDTCQALGSRYGYVAWGTGTTLFTNNSFGVSQGQSGGTVQPYVPP